MHELSIAYSLVELAEDAAHQAGASRVLSVRLRLGAIAGVVEDALRFCFPVAAAGTPVEGATLVVEMAPLEVLCASCGQRRTLDAPYVLRCPVCGSIALSVLQGRELQLESIEIEDASYATANS